MAKYRKKPIEFEAWLFTDDIIQKNHIPGVLDRAFLSELWLGKSSDDGRYYVDTPNGSVDLNNGDYVVRDINGDYYPCDPNVFKKTNILVSE